MEEATSASSESHFADLKHTMKDVIPCRVDYFVKQHINFVDGMVKKASQHYIKYIDASEMTKGNIYFFHRLTN